MPASWKQLFFQILLLFASCRHINTKTPGPTPSPGVPISPLPTDVKSVVLRDERHTVKKVELLKPVRLRLECTLAGNQNQLPNITGFWRKDGDEIENSRLVVQLENQQYNLQHEFDILGEKQLGNYSCVFGSEAEIDFLLAVPQIGDVREKPIVSYMGDSAVIECKIDDSKPVPNNWIWFRANGTEKEPILPAAEPHRYKIKNEERKSKLLVHELKEADSGLYYCGANYTISTSIGHVELKVITFFEPLKPFIAILVEVIVLVAAILLYEKSQSKKNYTAENQTNDQNIIQTQEENDGSEGSSSMRQRKV